QDNITLAQDTTKRLIAHFSEFERILDRIPREIAPLMETTAKDMAASIARYVHDILESRMRESFSTLRDTVQKTEETLKTAHRRQSSRHVLISAAFCTRALLTCLTLFFLVNDPLRNALLSHISLTYKTGYFLEKRLPHLDITQKRQLNQILGFDLFRKKKGTPSK
ncbi:MAG: hypothetical protein JNK42_04130, partial [Caedimonas sp.]|nr:hypothetical protein [Caedimonas sp.]